jgi:hypothetical protein
MQVYANQSTNPLPDDLSEAMAKISGQLEHED